MPITEIDTNNDSQSLQIVLPEDNFLVSQVNFSLPAGVFCPTGLVYALSAFRPLKGEGCVCLLSKPSSPQEELLIDWSKNVAKHQQKLKYLSIDLKIAFPGTLEQAEELQGKYSSWTKSGKWLQLPASEKQALYSFFSQKLCSIFPSSNPSGCNSSGCSLVDDREKDKQIFSYISEVSLLTDKILQSISREQELAKENQKQLDEISLLKSKEAKNLREISLHQEKLTTLEQTLTAKITMEQERKYYALIQEKSLEITLLRQQLETSRKDLRDKDVALVESESKAREYQEELEIFKAAKLSQKTTSVVSVHGNVYGHGYNYAQVKPHAANIPDHLEYFTIYQLMKMLEENGRYPASGYRKSYYIEGLQQVKRESLY